MVGRRNVRRTDYIKEGAATPFGKQLQYDYLNTYHFYLIVNVYLVIYIYIKAINKIFYKKLLHTI